jgi:creatinine amidohydrolase/Fe(II)-dependent formamide hydrolase-like protein
VKHDFCVWCDIHAVCAIRARLGPNEREKGYRSEAIKIMVDYLFLSKDITRVQAQTDRARYAGESETSMVLAIRKNLVDMKNAETGFMGSFDDKMMGLMYSQGIKAVSKNGVLGDSRKREAGKGEEYLKLWAEKMVDFVRKQIDI